MKKKVVIEDIDSSLVSIYFVNDDGEPEMFPEETMLKFEAYEKYDVVGVLTNNGLLVVDEEEIENEGDYYEYMGINEDEMD